MWRWCMYDVMAFGIVFAATHVCGSNANGQLYSREKCRNLTSNDVVAFVHVPKCAGSTFFTHAVKMSEKPRSPGNKWRWYPEKFCGIMPNGRNECRRSSYNSPGCASNVWGATHCSMSELEYCFARGWQQLESGVTGGSTFFATIVRHPVDRVISEYHWWRGDCDESNRPVWLPELCAVAQKGGKRGSAQNLLEWIESNYSTVHNRITKALATVAGSHVPGPHGPRSAECESFNASAHSALWGHRYSAAADKNIRAIEEAINTDGSVLASAIHNIQKKFAFVAIQERMEDSLVLLHKLCNLQRPVKVPSKDSKRVQQRTAHRSENFGLTARTAGTQVVHAILARNSLDIKLYENVMKQFDTTFRAEVHR